MGVAARTHSIKVIDVLVVGGIFRECFVSSSKRYLRYGGSGLVASVSAAQFDVKVALASYVGSEDDETVRIELQLAGVDDSPVLTLDGASGTFVFPIATNPDQPWPMYRPAESVPDKPPRIPEASVVLAFGIPDFDPVAQEWLLSMLPSATLIWDRQGWLSRARNADAVLSLTAAKKIYLANELEAKEDSAAQESTDTLSSQPPAGFDLSVIKHGVNGVDVYCREDRERHTEHVSAFPVSTRTTIGSGDVFAGAFAARIANGDSVKTAVEWGCAAAAVALRTDDCLFRTSDAKSIAALLEAR